MTVLAVSFDGTRISSAESATDGGTWDKWDASQTPSVEPDFFYQGVNSISNKVGSANPGGVEMDQSDSTHDMSSPDQIWLAKVNASNYQALDVRGSTGMILYIGSANTTDQYEYYVHGSDTYPLAGGWVFIPIDPNIAGYRDATQGSPDLNNVDYFGVSCEFSATSKSENVMMDAIDIYDSGTGLTIIHGSGADPAGTFADFLAFDEGTVGNRYGIMRSIEGILYVQAVLQIGDGTNETDFADTGQTIVFPDARCAAGWCGIKTDASVSGSLMSISDCTLIGRGSGGGTSDTRPIYEVIGSTGAVQYNSCVFRVFNKITLQAHATDEIWLKNCTLDGGLQLEQNGGLIEGCTILNATVATGVAFLICDDPAQLQTTDFTQTGVGHAIEITQTGTYTFEGNSFKSYGTGNDAAIYNNSGGLVTLNVTEGGDTTPTVRNGAGASTVINASANVTFGGMLDDTEVRVYDSGTGTEIAGIENATAGATDNRRFTWNDIQGNVVDYVIHNVARAQTIRVEGFTVPSVNTTIPIQQVIERNYDNPP